MCVRGFCPSDPETGDQLPPAEGSPPRPACPGLVTLCAGPHRPRAGDAVLSSEVLGQTEQGRDHGHGTFP